MAGCITGTALIHSIRSGKEPNVDDELDSRHRDISALHRQLDFWRERMQAAGSSCRSGVQRDYAARQIQELEQLIVKFPSRGTAANEENS